MNAESELVKAEPIQMVRPAGRLMLTREQLDEEVDQRRLLGEYVKKCMVAGTDYGIIPGTDKPALLKPGAEKLIALFNCSPEFEFVEKMCHEDFETGFFKYTFKCRIVSSRGAVLAEGVGSANSREKRYWWRDATRTCPACGKAAIIKGKAEYGGGWVCFKKKDGCNAKFKDDDASITGQQQGRVVNEDIADLDNTILKMAKKRAQVDGAIALARCSDMFTQDVGDMPPPEHHQSEPPRQEARRAEEPPPPSEAPAPKATGPVAVAFGPHKGKTTWEIHDDELRETIGLARVKLQEQPKAKWAKAMRENLAALEAEQQKRETQPKKKERAPLTLEEAEKQWKEGREKMTVGFGDLGGKTLAGLADDEVTQAAEHIEDLLKRPEPMMAATSAKDMSLMLGLELSYRMDKAGAAPIV
jgi:hypothetical protein